MKSFVLALTITSVHGFSFASKAQTGPDLSKVVGVDPQKRMPADYGFDPLGLAKVDLNLESARNKNREADVIVKDYRDAELRHGRLAMLAALAWPMQELLSPSLARGVGEKLLLTEDGRSPSILNGGLQQGPIPFAVLGTAFAIAALDLRALKIKEVSGSDWEPGDYGFDPLNILKGASPLQIKDFQAKEINNGRLAMLAITAYVIQEAFYGEPIVVTSEQFFTPIFQYPWFQQLMTDLFGIASFRPM
mmetsp:Transcript_1887/g.2501  ORF Transcript_1887/g.2501 Transcript_1887/m.2501 type:complete len:248 (-) Transcript_1887:152-895(-)|eukprot:CAMPEP_0197286786 /NCGR_PEP_ID=MMETSP0890-20130614/2449_1 /TAXON_ID=44058 ORGANISM="Aureoumbra lagunensis, Strain CCMP1510" /NCGR_SAMPLE_ID=MMETSP0890 /ASSEMBLY_ACC=CAM_ASM_000533 /LENGTH=247 /DNA_ID=CAMNT_0042755539 /DNA_START=86 /DNA_END=829 /DNA_ORIENTATION=+